MGRIEVQADPSMPTMSIEEAVSFCRRQGVDLVTGNTLKFAIRRRELRRHLISNRVRLSENDIRDWIASTANADFIDRRAGRAS